MYDKACQLTVREVVHVHLIIAIPLMAEGRVLYLQRYL